LELKQENFITIRKQISTVGLLPFESGARIEIMTRSDITENAANNAFGYAHITLSVGSTGEVDRLTKFLSENGVTVLSQPRTTGDGYYESKISDPDRNEIEITV
jgi:lactoylglutathione lyase